MPGEDSLDEKEWSIVLSTLNEALDKFTSFRTQEGKVLETDMATRIKVIQSNLSISTKKRYAFLSIAITF